MGAKTPKQKISANEILQAQLAGQRDQEFVEDFLPLEQDAIAEISDTGLQKNRRDILAGRLNADAEQAEQGNLQATVQRASASGTGLNSGANISEFEASSVDAASNNAGLRVKADRIGRVMTDEDRLNVIRTGRDLSRQTGQGLASLAQSSFTKEAAQARAKQDVKRARNAALGKVAATAIYAGGRSFVDANNSSLGNKEVGLIARGLRRAGVGQEDEAEPLNFSQVNRI